MRPACRLAWELGLLLATVASALAALPPYYERTREMSAVIGDAEVKQKLGNREIVGIEAVAPATYRVWSDRCWLEVKLVGKPHAPPLAGPWQFEIRPGEAHCK